MSEPVLVSSRPVDGVCVIHLNRPAARNAFNVEMQAALDGLLRELEPDPAVRAIVVTGAGDKAFSAGYDVKEMSALDDDGMLLDYLQRQRWMGYVAHYPKPLIAAVNGAAHGAGAIIATAMDIRVGGPRTEFRFTAASYGGANNTWQLPLIVGYARAKEFTMTARRIGADEALGSGLINHLVDDAAVLDKAVDIATQIAANSPEGVQWHKRLIHENVGRSYRDAYDAENTVMNGELRPGRVAELFGDFLARSRK